MPAHRVWRLAEALSHHKRSISIGLRALLLILLPFLVILLFLGGAGIGIGFFLHWLIPAIGVDIGSLIGVITFIWTIHFYSRLMTATMPTIPDDVGAGDSERETIVFRPIRPKHPAKAKRKHWGRSEK